MSSGNYQRYEPKTWFDYNRNSIIDAFDKKARVLQRNRKIKKLKKEIERLEDLNTSDWKIFRDKCIASESVD